MYHINYSLGFLPDCADLRISEYNLAKVKTALDQIDANINNVSPNDPRIISLAQTLKKNTTTPAVRISRCKLLLELLLPYLG